MHKKQNEQKNKTNKKQTEQKTKSKIKGRTSHWQGLDLNQHLLVMSPTIYLLIHPAIPIKDKMQRLMRQNKKKIECVLYYIFT
jgi:hypothetical protein